MCSLKREVIVETFFTIVYAIIFLYFSGKAVIKYYEEPLATQIYYTTKEVKQLPVITICNYEFVNSNTVLKECRGQSKDYHGALKNCLKNPEFSLDSFNQSLEYDTSNIAGYLTIRKGGSAKIDIDPKTQKQALWKPLFHHAHGLCYSLNLDYKSLEIENETVSFKMAFNKSLAWNYAVVILHNKNELADSYETAPNLNLDMSKSEITLINVATRMVHRQSTKQHPCGKYMSNTCNDIKAYSDMIQKFQCKSQYLYFGEHLDSIDGIKSLPDCSKEVLSKAIANFTYEFYQECHYLQPCQVQKYTHTSETVEKSESNMEIEGPGRSFMVKYAVNEVEVQETTVSYDSISLIGEIGGLIGLTLGWCGMSLANLCNLILDRLCPRY